MSDPTTTETGRHCVREPARVLPRRRACPRAPGAPPWSSRSEGSPGKHSGRCPQGSPHTLTSTSSPYSAAPTSSSPMAGSTACKRDSSRGCRCSSSPRCRSRSSTPTACPSSARGCACAARPRTDRRPGGSDPRRAPVPGRGRKHRGGAPRGGGPGRRGGRRGRRARRYPARPRLTKREFGLRGVVVVVTRA
jgi:hypothetical protein